MSIDQNSTGTNVVTTSFNQNQTDKTFVQKIVEVKVLSFVKKTKCVANEKIRQK